MLKSTMTRNGRIIKLPGLIDVHVHLREPGATQKEDFYTGTQAAVAGGYTQILDMPNNPLPTITPAALAQKINLAKGRIWCDVGFNFGGTADSTHYFKKVAPKVFALKVYMNATTGPLLVDKAADRELIFKSWTSPLPIMVHAEGETVQIAIKLAQKYQKPLHICHVTTDQLKPIQKAKADGLNITSEVTPHHLFLTKDDQKRFGPFALMKPFLLTKKDQDNLWDSLDKIDIISNDHAPHTLEEKRSKSPPFGVPGLETTLPLMFTAVAQGKLTTQRLIEMASTNSRRIFKLPAQPDTYSLVDFTKTYKITALNLFTKCRWTPFEGMDGRGEIQKVVIRGKVVYQDGHFIGKPTGIIIKPNVPTVILPTLPSSSHKRGSKMNQKNLAQLKKKLTPEQYNICFLKGTEPPFSGKYTDNFDKGMYNCVVCNTPLFYSDSKFHSDSGWLSFDKPVNPKNVKYEDDYSLGMHRTEILCNNCGAHLGHLFDDGATKTGKRYCLNSLALNFHPKNMLNNDKIS